MNITDILHWPPRDPDPNKTAEACWLYWWVVYGEKAGPIVDVRRLIHHLGLRYSGTITSNSLVGLCVPLRDTIKANFVLDYNPKPTDIYSDLFTSLVADEQAQYVRLYQDVILGHELGHTFFYRWRPRTYYTQPTRSHAPNTTEEKFCDAFAIALTSYKRSRKQRDWLKKLEEKFLARHPRW